MDEMQKGLGWWYSKVHQRDRERVKNKVDACFKQGQEHWQDEYRFRCADKKYKYFVDKGVIVYKEGKPVRAIGIIQDITEKKALEEKLLRQEVNKQKAVSQAIIMAQDHERNELSKELHDNVNQILSSAGLFVECINDSEEQEKVMMTTKSREYIQLAIQEIRKLTKSLNTSTVKDAGLMEPVSELMANLTLSHRFAIDFDYDMELEKELPGELKLTLYRIIQEQTNNIVKYANATDVTITIRRRNGFIYMVISDNGKGFILGQPKTGIGLTNMRTRVEAFNGTFKIISSPGKGCQIKMMVPAAKLSNHEP